MQFPPPYPLILAGTPKLGDTYAVDLDPDSGGRVTDFQLERFSPFEIAAVLMKKFGKPVDFDPFLTTWSLGGRGSKTERVVPDHVKPCTRIQVTL